MSSTYGLKFIQESLRAEKHPEPCGTGPCTFCWFDAKGGFIDEQITNVNRQHQELLDLVRDAVDADTGEYVLGTAWHDRARKALEGGGKGNDAPLPSD